MSQIPIQNIYFLLCYAWDRLEERDIVQVSTEGITRHGDLFGRVLASGVSHLLKGGVDRAYQVREDRIAGVRGKLLFSETTKANLLPQARTLSAFDELSHDVIHNRILRATLRSLLRIDDLDVGLRNALSGLYRRMNGIPDIRLSAHAFRAVQLHRNIRFYDFLLKVCRLVFDHLMINESSGSAKFRDFTRDDRAMAVLYQRFLVNFYKKEQLEYTVTSPHIEWHDVTASEADLALLPTMRSDLVLRSPNRLIVTDAKYYREALQSYRGKRTVRSAHLYQILSYLNNLRAAEERLVEGLLLYPTVEMDFEFRYVLNGHKVTLRTVNLSRPWRDVSAELLQVLS